MDSLRLLRMDLSLCKAGVGPGSGGRVCGRVDVKVCLVAGIELSDPWGVSCAVGGQLTMEGGDPAGRLGELEMPLWSGRGVMTEEKSED